jgi:hypothetical protein
LASISCWRRKLASSCSRRISRDGAVADFHDAAYQPVHEVAVVTGHQQRATVFFRQPVLQPDDRFDIEMVGRFVEQQYIRIQGQDSGQGDTHFPAAAERFNRPRLGLRIDAEAGQNRFGTVFKLVAAAVFKFLLGVAVTLQQVCQGIVRHRFAHGRFHFADSPSEFHGARRCGYDLFKGGASGHFADILGKIAYDGFLCAADFTAVRHFLAGDQAENGGLAGTVGADQAGACRGGYLKAGPIEKDL